MVGLFSGGPRFWHRNSLGPREDTTGLCGVCIISGILPPGCSLDLTLLNNAVYPALMTTLLALPTALELGFQAAGFEWEDRGGSISSDFSKHFSRGKTKRKVRKI